MQIIIILAVVLVVLSIAFFPASRFLIETKAKWDEARAIRRKADAEYLRAEAEDKKALALQTQASAQHRALDVREREIEQKELSESRDYHLRLMQLKIDATRIDFNTQVILRENGDIISMPAVEIRMQEVIAGPRGSSAAGQGQIAGPTTAKGVTVITPDFPAQRALFSDVFKTFTPTKEHIYLLDTVNGPITGPLTGVTHVALVGPTGGGKTITTRMLTAQFQFVGAKMYLASPNFAQLKLNGNYLEDWRPIVQHLAEPPAQTANEIDSLLKRFKTLFEKRKAKEQSTPRRGADIFLILGEWPGIVARCPDAAEIIVLLLREARQYGIHLIFEFQDALVATLGVNSGARENIRHAYYYGGDIRTAKFALSLAAGTKVDETGLGKNGAVYMRTLISDQVVSGRVPLFNNQALYMLLGTPPDPVPDYEITDESQIPETYYHVENGQYVEGSATVVRTEAEIDTDPLQAAFSDSGLTFSQTRYNANLTVIRGGSPASPEVSETRVSELVEAQDSSPDEEFIPGPGDGLVQEDKHDDLAYFYAKERDVKKALRAIGVGNQCFRHASFILERRGLKQARRA